MKKEKTGRLLSIMLAVSMVIAFFPMTANAASTTVNEGQTYTTSNFRMEYYGGSSGTFTNNGTVSIADGFLLYNATFTNNGTFTYAGTSSSTVSTFNVSGNSMFENNGTATISGSYNFCAQVSFVNNGTLFLSDIKTANVTGLSNTGTIVYGDNVSTSIIQSLKDKTSGTGQVLSEEEYNNNSGAGNVGNEYKITYDLNGGSWTETPASDDPIFSYTYDSSSPQWYTIGFDAPFDTLNDRVAREYYDFAGWTCDKYNTAEPSKYLDILAYMMCDITLTAHWTPKTQYIFYDLNGGSFPEGTTVPEIKNDGTNTYTTFNIESEAFTLPTPVKSGYDFVEWQLGGTTETYSSVTIPKGTTGNRRYAAKWAAKGNTPYTVNVYYMDETGQYGTTPESHDETGVTDTTVEIPASAYAKTGFTYDAAKSVNTGTIAANGSLVLSLYYARNQYDITFKSQDGTETLYTYQGYYGTPIAYGGPTPEMTEEGYIYTFEGWSVEAESACAVTNLGTVSGEKTYYAVFEKEATFYLITFEDTTGFLPLEKSEIRINKGDSFSIDLYLASEKYYVGTNEWGLTYDELCIINTATNNGLVLGEDFAYSYEGYGNPVVLSIPHVTSNLDITFCAKYHDTHDFAKEDDTILKEATCTQEGEVRHYCYKCGRTEEETIPVDPINHTHLVKIEAKPATDLNEGNMEYYYCDGCGKYFSDEAGTKEIELADTILPKLTDETCLITFKDTTGFLPLEQSEIRINKGDDFSINLYLASENYYVGTNEWTLIYNELYVLDVVTNKGLVLGEDFTFSYEGYGNPVVLSIPNVTDDLNIIFSAAYHDTHDFTQAYDTVLKEATCIQEGAVLHYCYKCGKTEEETTPVNPANHTHLVKVEAKPATYLADGNAEYYYCDGCGRYFSDETGTQEIELADTIIPKLTIDKVDYEITSGADGSYMQGSDGSITITGNGEFSKFVSVMVDGNVVDACNYTAKEGSTIITLKAAYLDTLSAGTHTFEIVWTDGSASTNFTVGTKASDETEEPADSEKPTNPQQPANEKQPKEPEQSDATTPDATALAAPDTGDSMPLGILFMMLGLGIAELAVVFRFTYNKH
ncbi:MAG: hypothetical protein ACI4AD_00025 [Roseburia sp.]